jgi:hypothetical protein
MFKNALLIAGALLLGGCATPFYNAQTAGPLLEQTAHLPASSIRAHASCQIAFAPTGASKADFQPGACAYTDTTLYLYSWDDTNKRYRREVQLDFKSLPGYSKSKLAMWSQLQVPVDGGRLVMESKSVEAFAQMMQQAGVQEVPSLGYVNTNLPPQPTTIYIPVYLPG